jgi:hypothetical protein
MIDHLKPYLWSSLENCRVARCKRIYLQPLSSKIGLASCGEDACHRFLRACFQGIDSRNPETPSHLRTGNLVSFLLRARTCHATRAVGSHSTVVRCDGKWLSNRLYEHVLGLDSTVGFRKLVGLC